MKIKDGYTLVSLGFTSLLVPVEGEALRKKRVITMNEESACLIQALQEDRSEDDLVEIMTREFDVDSETVKQDIHEHLKKLDAMDLLAG